MDPLLNRAAGWSKTGVTGITLLAGAIMGIYLYQTATPFLQKTAEPRTVVDRGPLLQQEQTLVNLFEETAPSVVYITTARRGYISRWSRRTHEVPQGSGSGFIWNKQGHIVTNAHVIQEANSYEVVLYDQSTYDAKLVGYFLDKDLAVLQIDAPPDKLRPVPLGTTADLKVGQNVFAIGNPFGLDHTLTTGIVSALDRTLESLNSRRIQGAIQTDAAINPGNSGGPLLDSAGRLIGVNTQIFSTSGSSAGIGFAIPVDTVNEVVPLLIRDGKVSRPGLGVYIDQRSFQVTRHLGIQGLMIREVVAGGAADEAGLRGLRWRRDGSPLLGDILIAIEDKKLTNYKSLANILDGYKVGDTVTVTAYRDEREIKVKVILQPVN